MEPITTSNQKEKSELMLEQYGRTASLFSHNVAMISMGDDFRFTKELEWDQQYANYMKLFNYINSHKDVYNAEVKFGTVSDYFNVRLDGLNSLYT
jgi:alpha-mannosidase